MKRLLFTKSQLVSRVATRTFATVNEATSSKKSKFTPAFPLRSPGQPFPERKAYLYAHYKEMMAANSPSARGGLLILQHNNLTASELVTIRRDLNAAFTGKQSPVDDNSNGPVFEIVRHSVLRAALPRSAKFSPIRAWLCGPICVVRLPADAAPEGQITVGDPTIIKRALDVLQQHRKLILLGGRFERHWLTANGVKEAAKLPTIDHLRAELLGLLSTPAQQLRSVLEHVPGALARSLKIHQENLEKAESA
jgi:large subunit ribosomal protein L10